jgi:hypothetical protein
MAKVTIDYDDRRLRRNIRNFRGDLDHAVSVVTDRTAAWGTGYMKVNAPWTDRTGAARGGLAAIPHNSGGTHEIDLAYSVYYGIFLEVCNSGKYAIITPSIRIIGQKLMQDLNGLLEHMNR